MAKKVVKMLSEINKNLQ